MLVNVSYNFSFFRIPLSANYICVRCSNDGTYQYAVSFSPQVDSLGMRKKIIHNHEGTIGRVHAFDGATLYVPKQLNGEVSRCLVNDNKLLDSMFISTGWYISLGLTYSGVTCSQELTVKQCAAIRSHSKATSIKDASLKMFLHEILSAIKHFTKFEWVVTIVLDLKHWCSNFVNLWNWIPLWRKLSLHMFLQILLIHSNWPWKTVDQQTVKK